MAAFEFRAPTLIIVMAAIISAAASADPLAEAFGSRPGLWGLRLSPDGTKISFLQAHPSDLAIATVFDTKAEKSNVVLASDKGRFDLRGCEWANNERLLCSYYGIAKEVGRLYPTTRLVAVDADASDMKVLLQRKLSGIRTQFQDDIVDWLPDDPDHVLIEMPDSKGTGVVRLDVRTGSTRTLAHSRANVQEWLSDGRGALRLRMSITERKAEWRYTLAGENKWRDLHESDLTELFDPFVPVGFGEEPISLLVFKASGDRLALWSEDLANDRKSELIFAHPEVDVGDALHVGKYGRIVAVGYSTDRPHLHFFDLAIKKVTDRISREFPGQVVQVVDESWDRKIYIVHVRSDQNPGVYYLFDTSRNRLSPISPQYPQLEGRTLAAMKPIHYEARDGVEIPGYLTAPAEGPEAGLPAVILPHGGPHSRDYWGYDWLAHYFAARGYAVLQSNYRGSGGFGSEWLGEGAFKNWRRAIEDIDDGVQHLIDSGVIDPERVCIVGWSYGGYAALMSAAEFPERYRCVVSIAGVTDLDRLVRDSRRFVGGRRTMEEYIGRDDAVLLEGSPVKRAADIQAPVLLFHGDHDVNVSIGHSKAMKKELNRKKKTVTLVEYEDVEHSIRREAYRMDMLAKIGALLDETTRAVPSAAR